MENKPATILVVDDNENNRNLLSRRLQRQGHDIVMAENGRQALDKMREQAFDLVLLDIMMPEMNGYQVLERMKADTRLRHLPVIVVSALDEIDSVVRCIELGAEDYLPKPFNRVLLQARVSASLEKKRLHDRERAYLQELEVLQQLDGQLNTTLDLQRALCITLGWARRQSGSSAGLIGLVEPEGIRIMGVEGYADDSALQPGEYWDHDLAVVHEAIQGCRLCRMRPEESAGLPTGGQSQLVVPICREAETIGLLILDSDKPEGYSDEMLAFLSRLCDHAALAIANAQLYEAVQAATQAKSDFISFISHELKNPMASIFGYTRMLQQGIVGPTNEMQASFLDTIHSNVVRMDTLVSDLSDISKVEAGRIRLEFGAVSPADVVDEVVRSLQGQIEEKQQTLEVEIAEGIGPVWADRTRLVQVLTNLVSNAHKFTLPGGTIWLRAGQMDNESNPETAAQVVHVAVQDTGVGITEEDRKRIFEQFFRARDDKTQEVPGTGLGLHITKQLVEIQGGRIWFESGHGKGSTFHFTVPVTEAA